MATDITRDGARQANRIRESVKDKVLGCDWAQGFLEHEKDKFLRIGQIDEAMREGRNEALQLPELDRQGASIKEQITFLTELSEVIKSQIIEERRYMSLFRGVEYECHRTQKNLLEEQNELLSRVITSLTQVKDKLENHEMSP